MTKEAVAAAIAVLEKTGYTVLPPVEAKAIKQILPMLTEDEIGFVFRARSSRLQRCAPQVRARLRRAGCRRDELRSDVRISS